MNDAEKYLRSIANELPSNLREACLDVLTDERFLICPGAQSHHHCYKGGLAVHTSEVAQFARQMTDTQELKELLTIAAIFHDRNKIFEYEIQPNGKIKNLPYRHLVGHVVGSWQYFNQRATAHNIDENLTFHIGHCLLTHHGRREWGSPVEPQTKEALILHSADMLSMQKGKAEIDKSK